MQARCHSCDDQMETTRPAYSSRTAGVDRYAMAAAMGGGGPPGNRLEKLAGDRAGQYSIRINQQWRICFRWTDAGPEDVEITDYH